MAQKNDETTAIAMGVAFVGMVLMMLAVLIFAIATFLTFVLTIAAIVAWNKPLRIGKLVIEPEEARAFVGRGVIGAVIVPVFIAFCSILFSVPFDWTYWPYFLIAGYVGGSLGIEILMADENQRPAPPAYQPPQPSIPAPRRALPAAEPEPFRFASWDDEEKRG